LEGALDRRMRADASARWALRSLERLEISWRLLWIAGFDPKRTDGLCKIQDFCDSDFALKIVTFREPDSIAWRARPATLLNVLVTIADREAGYLSPG